MRLLRLLQLLIVLLVVGFVLTRMLGPKRLTGAALESCVYLGQPSDQTSRALERIGYSAVQSGSPSQLNYSAKKDGHSLNVRVDLNASGLVNQASGVVARVTLPGGAAVELAEPRAQVSAALGPPSHEKVDNYAGRWAVYDQLNLTLVFDEDDKLQRAYLAHPAYQPPEETEEAR